MLFMKQPARTRCAAVAHLSATLALAVSGTQAMALPTASPPLDRYACVAHAKGWFEADMAPVFSLQVTSPTTARIETVKGARSEGRFSTRPWPDGNALSSLFDRGVAVTLAADGGSQPFMSGLYGERGAGGAGGTWLLKMKSGADSVYVRCGDKPASRQSASNTGASGGQVATQPSSAPPPSAKKRDVDAPSPPVRLPAGARLGGDFEPGRYRCVVFVPGGQAKNGRTVVFDFFPGGDWRNDRKDHNTGTYAFNPATGRFSAYGRDTELGNGRLYADDVYTVHYRTSDDVMRLYAHGTLHSRCERTGPVQGEPPKQVAQRKADEQAARQAQRVEAARQVHAAPGQGMQPGDFETILFSWDQDSEAKYGETIYLLLKDGTAYKDMRLPPEDFNLEAAKRLQPDRWRVWRRQGNNYEVRTAGQTNWTRLKAWPGIPGKDGERLSRSFSQSSFSGSLEHGGTYAKTTLSFNPAGRFEQFGELRTGTGHAQAAQGTTAQTTRHSSGRGTSTHTGVSTPGGANGGDPPGTHAPGVTTTGSGHQSDGANRRGSYKIKGWTIEFRRDNGEVQRSLFLFRSEKRDAINIAGQGYSTDKR
jgi:hypothetical protein